MSFHYRCSYKIEKTNRVCKKNRCHNSKFCTIHKNMENNKVEKENNKVEIEQEEGEKCAICLTSVSFPKIKLECNHEYCEECFKEWTKEKNYSCPYCRKIIIFYQIIKNKKSKPINYDFSKDLIHKYKEHVDKLLNIHLYNMHQTTLTKNEKTNFAFASLKNICEYLFSDGKCLIMLLPKFKQVVLDKINEISNCNEELLYVQPLIEFYDKINKIECISKEDVKLDKK